MEDGCGEEGNEQEGPEGLECVTQAKYSLTLVHENAGTKPIVWNTVTKFF